MQNLRPDDQAIRDALEQVLSSPSFRRSGRQAEFLRYVVEENIANPQKKLSSFEIFIDCFERPTPKDPNDAYVRNIASQTRRSLNNYYESLEKPATVIIRLPAKGYAPNFSRTTETESNTRTRVTTASSAAQISNTKLSPSLAVIPFQCLAGDNLHGVMGELISDSLITSLAKSKHLRVISRRTSALFGSADHPTSELGEKLGANYIVSGRYHVHGDTLRLHVELCCCENNEMVWAERLISSVEAVVAETDDLVEQTLYGITRNLLDHELQRALSTPLMSLQCHSLLIGSVSIMHRGTASDFNRAREMLELLAQRNPHHATPFAHLAYWGVLDIVRDADYGETEMGREFVQNNTALALERDSHHPIALTANGVIRSHFESDFHGARNFYEQAIQYSPNEAPTMGRLSVAQLYTVSATKALDTANSAVEASPFDPELYFFYTAAAAAAFGEKKYGVAIEKAEISRKLFPNHPSNLRTLISSYTAVNDAENASKYKSQLLRIDPQFNLEKYRQKSPFPENEIMQRLTLFLGKSGVPARPNK